MYKKYTSGVYKLRNILQLIFFFIFKYLKQALIFQAVTSQKK